MILCKHEWELLTETVTVSKFEVAMAATPAGATSHKLPWQLCDADRKHIQTFTCAKCGKLKRFVENI